MMFRLILAVAFVAAVNAKFRIMNGEKVQIQDYPYQVVLLYDFYQIGGGAVVSSRHVLTAAHVHRKSNSLDKYDVGVGHARYKMAELFSVRSFDSYVESSDEGMPVDDLAVITLDKPITFTDRVQPIAIVPEGQEPKPGDMLTATGWGYTESSSESRDLLMARLPCIEKAICREAWKVRSHGKVHLRNNTLCAGGGMASTFIGDSGGPLVNDKKQLVGIISWGKNERSLLGYPAIFVNLADPDMQKFITARINS